MARSRLDSWERLSLELLEMDLGDPPPMQAPPFAGAALCHQNLELASIALANR